MKISDLITELEVMRLKHGDIEVTTQGTLLEDGYSRNGNDNMADVFESTIETLILYDKDDSLGKRVRLFWQM